MILGFILYFLLPFLAFVWAGYQTLANRRLRRLTYYQRAQLENAPWIERMKALREWTDTADYLFREIALAIETGTVGKEQQDDCLDMINTLPARLGREGKKREDFTIPSLYEVMRQRGTTRVVDVNNASQDTIQEALSFMDEPTPQTISEEYRSRNMERFDNNFSGRTTTSSGTPFLYPQERVMPVRNFASSAVRMTSSTPTNTTASSKRHSTEVSNSHSEQGTQHTEKPSHDLALNLALTTANPGFPLGVL